MATTYRSSTTRARVETQGFLGLDNRTLLQINYWLRLSPAICMAWTAVRTTLGSATILWALVPFAALGAILPGHPFDVLYNYGLLYLVRAPHPPRYQAPRRSACFLATLRLTATALCFQAGNPMLGHILGWSLVATAGVNVITGFCVPSFVYGLIFGRPSEHSPDQLPQSELLNASRVCRVPCAHDDEQ